MKEETAMYCNKCGKQLEEGSVFCNACGNRVMSSEDTPREEPRRTYVQNVDEPNVGLNIICFLLPIVGLILYLIYYEKEPRKAAALGKWALIGVAAEFGFGLIMSMMAASAFQSMMYF